MAVADGELVFRALGRVPVGRLLVGVALTPVLLSAVACGGPESPLEGPGATPLKRSSPAVPVDVCELVPESRLSQILERDLDVVGFAYGPSQVATARCEFGDTFDRPVLTVQLAADAVAPVVFQHAYGEAAGGDPVLVRRLGDRALLRTEGDVQSLHVFAHGSVLSLTTVVDPTGPITRQALVQTAEVAVGRLPANPVLTQTTPGRRCRLVDTAAIASALGARPTLASEFSSGREVTCSWAGPPGSVVVTLHTDPALVRRAHHRLAKPTHTRVDGIAPPRTTAVWSSLDEAGDLLIFKDTEAMVEITVIPTAGFADEDIETTPGERALGRSVWVSLLTPA